jgi:hypothetical protein
VLVFLMLYYLPDPPRAIVYASLIFPLYYAFLSFFLTAAQTNPGRGKV